ncbi:MAG: GNAT family N-acetyltransferase [Deltaproteobacteria bacterium]|nr:GNAT family N-acetyltransferase [Deltaproteobacteria bacterium]
MTMDPTFRAPVSTSTERVLIRSWMPGEGRKLSEALAGSYAHLSPWMPWASEQAESAEVMELRVRGFRARYLLGENFILPILSADGARCLGGTGFHLRHGAISSGVAEIGMWVRADESGKGLGKHVLAAMVEWAWTEWPWRRLVWRCSPENTASRRTAESAGFVLEGISREDAFSPQGELRSTCVYALLKG